VARDPFDPIYDEPIPEMRSSSGYDPSRNPYAQELDAYLNAPSAPAPEIPEERGYLGQAWDAFHTATGYLATKKDAAIR